MKSPISYPKHFDRVILFILLLSVCVSKTEHASASTIYAATENGVFKSTYGSRWTAANSGLPAGISALAVDPSNNNTLYAGIGGGVSKLFKSTNEGHSWTRADTGHTDSIVLAIIIDPTNTNTLYTGTATGAFFPGNQVFKSTNAGQTWTVSNTGLPNSIIQTIVIDPLDPSTLYVGTNNTGVFKSINGGQSWTVANNGIGNQNIGTLAIDPKNPQILYAGIAVGGNTASLFKTTDGGHSWKQASLGLPSQVVSLIIDPINTTTLYASTRVDGVFKSVDGAANWSVANSGLISTRGYLPLALDPLNPSMVYAGTADGVYASADSGMNWISFNTGLPASTGILAFATASLRFPQSSIQLKQSVLMDGNTLIVTNFRLTNQALAPVVVELKVWIQIPGILPISLLNLGSDGTFALPAMFNHDLGPLTLFSVTSSLPRGAYEFGSRILDPMTGRLLNEEIDPFRIH